MAKILAYLYTLLPSSLLEWLGKSKLLAGWRNRLLRKNAIELCREVRVRQKHYGLDFIFNAPVKIGVAAKKNGIEARLLQTALKLFGYPASDSLTIIDAGASNGFLTCVFAQTLGRHGQVFSFEPHPDIFKRLKGNAERNKLDQITCIHKALADTDDFSEINLYHETANLIRFQNKAPLTSETVELCTLDSFSKGQNLQRCDLIKIDVDGYEYQVLKGAMAMISKYHPVIIYESNQQEAPGELLKQSHYHLYDLNLEVVSGARPLPHDIVALPPNFKFTI